MESLPRPALLGAYLSLSNEDKIAFLRALANASTADHAREYLKELNAAERPRFAEWRFIPDWLNNQLFEALWERAKPMISDAIEKGLSTTLAPALLPKINEIISMNVDAEREKFKKKRDRKSSPETILRNVQICDLRTLDKRKWTLGRLASKYDVTRQAIERVLKKEDHWRQLSSSLNSDK